LLASKNRFCQAAAGGQPNYENKANYFFVESVVVVVVVFVESTPFAVVSVTTGAVTAESAVVVVVVVEVESVLEASLALLSQATNTPAIARIPRNFFMCL